MDIEQIREKLKPFKLTEVAKATGMNYSVLRNIAVGASRPTYDDVQKIIAFLKTAGI